MKRFLLCLTFIFFIVGAQAQVNSVLLKDGSGTLLSQHISIAAAYSVIPATLSQAYIIEITNTYDGSNEAYPIVFFAKSGASSANTITLRPEAGVTAVSITATMTGEALLRLDDADWIIIDGRPGGTGTTRALTINNQGTSSTSYGILLINGATNNNFRYFNISGFFSASSGGKGIYIGSSVNNPSGNSDNTFEFLTFGEGPRYHINSSGTVANKNNNLVVYGCEFKNIKFCGWWQQNGTGKVTIDSCFFYSDTTGGGTSGTGVFPILSDFQSDTLIATRNHIYNIDNSTNTTDVFGMCFRSFNPGSVLRVYNNMISLMAPNPSVDEIFGIELGTNTMNNPVDAEIYFNTVRVGGTATGGTAGNVNSAAFSMDESNTGSNINVRDNIFVNERTGGNEYHLAINLTEFDGNITLDYNTYNNAAADFAKYLTTLYPTFTTYQTALAPQETNSNDEPVQFVSQNDLHLSGISLGNSLLTGISIPGITTDFDNDLRTLPYRGADEAIVPGCFDPQLSHSLNLFSPDSVCGGDSVGMAVVWNALDTIPSIDIQWQSSLDGTTFSDIFGETGDTTYANPFANTYYRYTLTCQSTGSVLFSTVVYIKVIPPPSLLGINHTNLGLTYNFIAVGTPNVITYDWDFGDGVTVQGTNELITHTYSLPGTYTVTVIVSNNCGSDTATTTVVVITGINEHNNSIEATLYPNPVSDFLSVKADNINTISVFDLKGKLVNLVEADKADEWILNTKEYKSGIYFIRIDTDKGNAVRKFEIIK